MAVLTDQEKVDIIRSSMDNITDPTWTRGEVYAAIQAIEDVFENARPALNTAINAATSPAVLPSDFKTALVKNWLRSKFGRGG